MKRTIALAIAASLMATEAQAVVIYSENFEGMTVGSPLNGQMTAGQTWQSDVGNEFMIASNRSSGDGTKSVRVDSNNQSTWCWVNLPAPFDGSAQPTLNGAVDIWMDAGVAGATTYGLNVYGGAGGTTRLGGIRSYGAGTRVDLYDGTNWNISGATAPVGQWFTTSLSLTYATPSSAVLRYSINGAQVGSDQAINQATHSIRLYQFATVFPLTAAANFDNYIVESVPEPGTFAIFSLGMLALLTRRRR